MTATAVRPQWQRATRHLLRTELSLCGFLVVTLVALDLAATAVVSAAGTVSTSHWVFARYAIVWFPFSLMAIVAATHLPLHVASGLTRRAWVTTVGVVSAVMGAVYGLVLGVGMAVEGALYRAAGWPDAHGDLNPFAGIPLPETTLAAAAQSVAGHLSGALVTLAFYRWGWLAGILALPVTLAPVFLVGAGGLPTGLWTPVDLGLATPGAVLVALAVLAAALAALTLLTRRIAIHRVEDLT